MIVPKPGETVVLERNGEWRPGVVLPPGDDGTGDFYVQWLDENGEPLDPIWSSPFALDGTPLSGWSLREP